MLTANLKKFCSEQGIDLVGVAPVERFTLCPESTHPKNILPNAKNVIVLACRFQLDVSCVDAEKYSLVRNQMVQKMNDLSGAVEKYIQASGYAAKAPPCNDASVIEGRYRGPLSLKHAAQLAGIGKIGKNQLLMTKEFGNWIWLGAVVTESDLEADPLIEEELCPETCHLCIENCPTQALSSEELFPQLTCFQHAFTIKEKKMSINCWSCRTTCPMTYSKAGN